MPDKYGLVKVKKVKDALKGDQHNSDQDSYLGNRHGPYGWLNLGIGLVLGYLVDVLERRQHLGGGSGSFKKHSAKPRGAVVFLFERQVAQEGSWNMKADPNPLQLFKEVATKGAQKVVLLLVSL